MDQETSLDQTLNTVADYISDAGGDVQRHIVIPALLDLIGPISGKHVLDLYCGAGYLSRRLASYGALVTAIDNSAKLIDIAWDIDSREKHGINYSVSDPIDMAGIDDSAFDDIVCNMGLMLTNDLAGTIAELARLVKMGGRFIFTVLHPCFCMPDAVWCRREDGEYSFKAVDNYFSERWFVSDLVPALRSNGRRYRHRTLSTYVNALGARGFNVRRIVEPRPSEKALTLKPELALFNRLPAVIIIEAVFPYL
jgi:ubiquinone/menaquinone biosynthesis C-methylase UbiE